MWEAKRQPVQCWNERRVNLIDKHRWCLNLTTFRSYLTTCCSPLRPALTLVSPRESLSLPLLYTHAVTYSPPFSFSVSLLFFSRRGADRTAVFLFARSALQNCNHRPNEVLLARRRRGGKRERGESRENWKCEPSGTGIEPISEARSSRGLPSRERT